MLIDKYAVDVEIHSNSDAIEDFPREYAKLKEEEQQANGLDLLETKRNLDTIKKNKYIFNMISPKRLNKLFNIIHEKEKRIQHVLRKLNLLIFDDVIKNSYIKNLLDLPFLQQHFNSEIKDFLQVIDNKIEVTDKFIDYLSNQSDYYTFHNPRIDILKEKINDVSF